MARAGTIGAGTSLVLWHQDGTVACLNPRTGRVRARGSVAGQAEIDQLLGTRQAERVLYALSAAGVIAITVPAACRT